MADATTPVQPTPAEKKQVETVTNKAVSTEAKPLIMSGHAGKPFNIDGSGFGEAASNATLEISGRLVATERWNDRSIKGFLPSDIKPGPFVIRTGDGRVIKGEFKG